MATVTIGRGSFGGVGVDTSIGTKETYPDDIEEDERIANDIQRIGLNVTQLSTLINSIGTSLDSEQLRRNVHKVLQDTSDLSKQTGQLIKQYCQSRPDDETEYNEWKVNTERFKKTFEDVLRRFQDVQKETRVKERTSLRQSLIQSGYHDIEISDSGEIMKDGQQCQLEKIEEEDKLKLIKEREEALKQLEQDIVDLNGIFKDVAEMIHDQGEEINTAEENVIIAADNIEKAVDELSEAHSNMVASRKKRVAAAVIILVIVVVIVIIILAVTL